MLNRGFVFQKKKYIRIRISLGNVSLALCAYYKHTDAADHPPKVGSASFGRYKTDVVDLYSSF